MSEKDTKSSGVSGSSVVLVDKSASSRHKHYRPNELQDDRAPDLHKRSKVPAVPPVTEELKENVLTEQPATVEQIECEDAMSTKKHMHVPSNISSTGKRRGSVPENITMVPLDTAKKDIIGTSPVPIPSQIERVVSDVLSSTAAGKSDTKKGDDDSITEEIRELRNPETVIREYSEWSDDEEAGGLPRSTSHGSRVSRVVRQLFCCGVKHNAPSEEDIPSREFHAL